MLATDMATPDTTMAAPFLPTMSTTYPAKGGPVRTMAPLKAVMMPKEGARRGTPTRVTRAEGSAETQTPVRNPKMQDRTRKIQ